MSFLKIPKKQLEKLERDGVLYKNFTYFSDLKGTPLKK